MILCEIVLNVLNCMSYVSHCIYAAYCLVHVCAIGVHKNKWAEAQTFHTDIKKRYKEALPRTLEFDFTSCKCALEVFISIRFECD